MGWALTAELVLVGVFLRCVTPVERRADLRDLRG